MIREIHVTELAQELADNDLTVHTATIYDVRDPEAYQSGHIEGAVNQPVNNGVNEDILAASTGTNYVMCGGGSKAPRFANMLDELDASRDIVVLTGGTRGAKSAGMVIVEE